MNAEKNIEDKMLPCGSALYKEIPGLTVSALRELDAAHCQPGVLLPSCHGGKRANEESGNLEWRKQHWREQFILVLDFDLSSRL